jgi:hypothetical protein
MPVNSQLNSFKHLRAAYGYPMTAVFWLFIRMDLYFPTLPVCCDLQTGLLLLCLEPQ